MNLNDYFPSSLICRRLDIFILQTCDLKAITITELTNKFHAKRQRISMRIGKIIGRTFRAKFNGGCFPQSSNYKWNIEGSSRKGKFFICFHCHKTNYREEECLYKDKPFFHSNFCNKLGHSEKVLQLEEKKQPEQ